MFGISIEWWILYALIVLISFIALRSFMNGVRGVGAELRDLRNNVKELDGPEILHEIKEIKYIVESLDSNYDGFVLKERAESAGHRE